MVFAQPISQVIPEIANATVTADNTVTFKTGVGADYTAFDWAKQSLVVKK